MRRFKVFYKLVVMFALATVPSGLAFIANQSQAQTVPPPLPTAPDPLPTVSLKRIPVPEPANLGEFVKDKAAAVRLGKALFWDMQVGSDGVTACASCHFNAGADSRAKNQISPGLLRVRVGEVLESDPDTAFSAGGPNYHLRTEDFPFRQLADPTNRDSAVLFDTNDAAASQGVFRSLFSDIVPRQVNDVGIFEPDPIFHVGGVNVRRVEPRNTPTVINAVFNVRNFWDGRAQSDFNGVNPFGARDRNAKVVRVVEGGQALETVRIRLDNASLASQAVGPPVGDTEMAFRDRSFRMVGKKLLSLRPLGQQRVHRQDSALGALSRWPLRGIRPSYGAMIQDAFEDKWWRSDQVIRIVTRRAAADRDDNTTETAADPIARDAHGDVLLRFQTPRGEGRRSVNEFTLMEYNFALFFGLAVQLYEATLVSDDTPFDRFLDGDRRALTIQQQEGLGIFKNTTNGRCINCHGGTEMTHAGVSIAGATDRALPRLFPRQGNLLDTGFFNIGVRPISEDPGVGGTDPWGGPLSDARRARIEDPSVGPGLILGVDGAFKSPGLRNVELTAPYFHNGGQLTLEQVIDFYVRKGDFVPTGRDGPISQLNPLDLGTEQAEREGKKAALVAFLRALTDERVRYRKAPFDHPELFVPNGHPGDHRAVVSNGAVKEALDTLLRIDPVGRNGGAPLPTFRDNLAPDP